MCAPQKFHPIPPNGCNRKMLLSLNQTLVRSILDYRTLVYGLAPPSKLILLFINQNASMSFEQVRAWAYVLTPVSPCSTIGTLHYPRVLFFQSYNFHTHQFKTISLAKPAVSPQHMVPTPTYEPTSHQIRLPSTDLPHSSYMGVHSPNIILNIMKIPKTSTQNSIILALFRETLYTCFHRPWCRGSGTVWAQRTPSEKSSTVLLLRDSTSILTAELLSLIHIWRCRRSTLCRSRWSPYH